MNGERWQSVKDILHQALQLPAEQRPPFLDQVCSCDVSLRTEVESLLAADDHIRTSFLQSPAAEGLVPTVECSLTLEPGQMFAGRFLMVRPLGEGGMGQVWLADQTSPVRRQVALKLIRAGMYDRSVVQRFLSERQSLAVMDHPAIAKVFDAGTTEQGQPYFVMEYVPGVSITEYCDQKKLTIKERLELLIQVCEGVQHAHQKAVIHRDLKPANILVVEVDGRAVPRIIDFGLAKAASPRVEGETQFTQAGGLFGTPAYMSPEQADPAERDIDTRTDVYSLGVVLYELLTGALPIDMKQWQNQPLEALQKLREQEPEAPSTKVSKNGETSAAIAQGRGTEPVQLVSFLRGDLDWIAMKALEKDRTRRYGAPSELAADIQRYLKHEPVTARPASTIYRAKRYVRRHRLTVAVVGTLVLLLAGFVVVQTIELGSITRERDRADREAAIAEAVNEFLKNDLLAQAAATVQAGPNTKPDPDLKVRTALDRAAERIEGKFAKQPEVEASIRDTIGWTYLGLGLYPAARKQLERSLELRQRVLGTKNAKTLKSMSRLGWVADAQGRHVEAEALENQALQAQRRILGSEHRDTLMSTNYLATIYGEEGKFAQAAGLLNEALESEKRVLGPEHPVSLQAMDTLGQLYQRLGKFAEAEALRTQALEIRKRVLGTEHPDTLRSIHNLAWVYELEGKYAQAEVLFAQALEIQKHVLGTEHPDTLGSMGNLAGAYHHEGKYAQAEALYTQALDASKRVLGPEDPETLAFMNNMAQLYIDENRYAQAEALFTQALGILSRVRGPKDPDAATILYNLGCVAARRGEKDRALALLRQSIDHGLLPRLAVGMDKDTDLTSLQRDPLFVALVAYAKQIAEAKQVAAATQTPK